MSSTNMHALIAGGLVGGLATAIALDRIGATVSVFERSPGQIQSRGAGVVMQPEVEFLLNRIGSSARSVSVPLSSRQRMDRDGRVRGHDAVQLMTSWDTLYRTLRRAIPDTSYRFGSKLVSVDERGSSVTARFADGHTATADVLIGADGLGSAARRSAGIPGSAQYSGYVAWRGLEPEDSLPEHIVAAFHDRFTLFAAAGLQFLAYFVPGPNGETEPGRRRLNWVWYMNVVPDALEHALESRTGRTYRAFLPPREMTGNTADAVLDTAQRELPPVMAELVGETDVFMQPVYDVPLTRMRAGRTFLVGDAAGTVRPHTASGTSKAFGDAIMLAQAFEDWDRTAPLPESWLNTWEERRSDSLRRIASHGIRLADSSLLGTVGAPRFLGSLAGAN